MTLAAHQGWPPSFSLGLQGRGVGGFAPEKLSKSRNLRDLDSTQRWNMSIFVKPMSALTEADLETLVVWPDAVATPDAAETLIRGGYTYNFWDRRS